MSQDKCVLPPYNGLTQDIWFLVYLMMNQRRCGEKVRINTHNNNSGTFNRIWPLTFPNSASGLWWITSETAGCLAGVMMSSHMTNMPQILCYTYISQLIFCILCMKYVSKLIIGKSCLSVHNRHASSPSSLNRCQWNMVCGVKFTFKVVKFGDFGLHNGPL
jgi:hypothetical protein